MTDNEWQAALQRMGVRDFTARRWAPIFAFQFQKPLSGGDAELPYFLGQVLHESGMLERVEESLNYSAARLMAVWPSRFPTMADAELYERNPVALANKVYGGRLGNNEPGDGWRYRGRGLVQVTGKDNYRAVGEAVHLDLVNMPNLLSEPLTALAASVAWWEGRIPDAAVGDVVRITRLVNGGVAGLDERQRLTDRAREALA